ncbi:hypothetical protein GmHk_08G024126 [Glycine max]|nr:hypothetical protein GmHk_08G024126 [Glycine max]
MLAAKPWVDIPLVQSWAHIKVRQDHTTVKFLLYLRIYRLETQYLPAQSFVINSYELEGNGTFLLFQPT